MRSIKKRQKRNHLRTADMNKKRQLGKHLIDKYKKFSKWGPRSGRTSPEQGSSPPDGGVQCGPLKRGRTDKPGQTIADCRANKIFKSIERAGKEEDTNMKKRVIHDNNKPRGKLKDNATHAKKMD